MNTFFFPGTGLDAEKRQMEHRTGIQELTVQ